MNVCSVHLYVVQIPTAQMKREVTIAHVWMDSLQQTQVSTSASITHVQVHFCFVYSSLLILFLSPSLVVMFFYF